MSKTIDPIQDINNNYNNRYSTIRTIGHLMQLSGLIWLITINWELATILLILLVGFILGALR